MKRNMKFLSFAMACTVAVGAMGVPSIINRWTFADESLTSTTLAELTVNARDTQIIEVGQSVTFDNGLFKLWSPSGEVLHDYTDVSTTAYTFVMPGLYAYQYKNSDGVYSKQEYIVVNSVLDNEIVLTQQISAFAKTGTLVTIPNCSTDGVQIKVYSPYGEEVSVSNNKFSNISNVKGTYYIEYSKNGIYKYVTVEFGDTYSENEIKSVDNEDALYHFEYNDDLKEIEKNGVIYMFKDYKLGATVYDKYGRKVKDQNVTVAFDFDGSESEEIYLGTFEGNAFNLAEITDLDEAGAKKFTITIKDTKTGLEKTIEAPFKFNNKCVYIKSDGLVNDFITIEDIKAEGGFAISSASVTMANGYTDKLGVFASKNVRIKLNYPNDTGKVVGEDDFVAVTENKTDDIVTSVILESNKTDLTYDNIDTKRRIINADYSYTLDLGTVGNHTWTATNVVKIVKDSNSYSDNQAPKFGELEDYESIIKSSASNFTVPFVEVTDLLNTGESSNGVNLTVSYKKNGASASAENVMMGQRLTLDAGTYTFIYTAIDSCGNSAEKTITVKVYETNTNSDAIVGSVTAGTVSVIKTDDGYVFNLTGSNATNCLVYEDGKSAVMPKKVIYHNGKIASITVEETKNNFVIVLNAYNEAGKECYIGIGLEGKVDVENIKPFAHNFRLDTTGYELKYNNRLEVNVGDRVFWAYGNDYTIEATANYVIENGNIIALTSGTIQITDNQSSRSALIVVKTGEISTPEFYTSTKKVVSIKNADGTIGSSDVTISIPYIRNYFGYTLLSSVVTATSGSVQFENNTLHIDRVDNFTFRHTINYEGISKVLTETISSGNIQKPVINIEKPYESTIVSGAVTRINLIKATAVDKFGNIIKLGKDNIVVKDNSGKIIEIKSDGDLLFVEVENAGIYTVSYSVTDSDGLTAVDTINFIVTFPEEAEKGMSVWGILGIILGSLIACAGIGYVVYVCIKKNKKQQKFINKNRQTKKTENAGIVLYTIAESKDGSYWTVKKSNRVIAKEKSKEEAMQKITDEKCKIKVYSKNGRLIDSIDR